jgi:HEAT repeat protein
MNTEQKINIIIESLQHQERNSSLKIVQYLEDDDLAVKLTAIEALGEIPNSGCIKSILIELTENYDDEIRYYALESLKGYDGEDVFEAIVRNLKDSDELVRISVVEAIGDLNEIKGLEHLYEALTDKEEIVRGYAAEGIGKIGKAASIPILEKHLKYETSSLSKLGFFVGLYLLGERKYLTLMLALLKDPSYRVRCAVANSVVDLLNQENVNLIKQSLLSALNNEQTNAARSSLQGALEEINS